MYIYLSDQTEYLPNYLKQLNASSSEGLLTVSKLNRHT